MVKIVKTPKNQMKQKKLAPPPKIVEESEEESSELDESSGEEMVPQKKQKVAVTPAKKAATPAKKVITPAKKAVTPAKKAVATPAKKAVVVPSPKKAAVLSKGAKNGKNAKKEESEEEDEDEDEDEDDDEDDEEDSEEPPMPLKPVAKKPAAVPAKKPAVVLAKQESEEEEEDDDDDEEEEDDESEDEAMDTAPIQVKKTAPSKAAPLKAKADSEDDENEEEDDEDEDEEDEDDEDEEDAEEESEDEKPVKEAPGKRKKEMASKSAPEAKKKKVEGPTSAFSVFVGNLASTKEFDELKTGIRDFFGKKNIEVLDVRIGTSKRFGYVDFSSAEDLDKALQMNGKKLMGLEVKLEKAKSKETLKENKKERDARTLFVKNLPYRITEDEIREVFENAVEVRMVMNKEGNSKGMAYIEFKSEAEANKALEEKQGTEVDGRAMVIDYTGEKSHQEHQKGGGDRESKTLIVNNLSYSASEETLQELFTKASSIKVPQTNQGRSKGYAFVEFPTTEDAKAALNSHNNTEIEGRVIRLEFSSPAWQKGGNMNARGGFNQQSKTLFVRGLSEDTTEETLRESFEGSISARIVTDRDTGSSKGFGFVDFSSAEDAKAAKAAMEDGEIDGNKVILDFAKPKSDFQRGGGFGGRGGRGGGRGGRGGFGGRGGGRGGFGGRGGGFRGGRGGGGDHKPQGKKIKFE
ncbi:nucleolin [Indicator indicator]|uniref:nucleolin n=1 Tax=Indicator indicator TaxID=1002788 RepID=UPI0023DFE2AE|nr:nucleolin [Indicator indicator]